MQSNAKSGSKPTSTGTQHKRGNEGMASKAPRPKLQSPAVQYLYDRYIGENPERVRQYDEEVLNAEIARKIYRLRTKAGISQRELAKRVGTTASAICRLEDADYEGHSLFMLKRIAGALDKRVEIRFVSLKRLRTA